MRGFSADEKQRLHELLEQYRAHPKKWIMISEKLSPNDISLRRTPDSLRNHVLRWEKGKERTAAGLSKKNCSICGKKKAGHVCGRVAAAPQGIKALVDLQADVDLPPLDSALVRYPIEATGRDAPWSPQSTEGGDDWLAGPPDFAMPESDFIPDIGEHGLSLPALALPPLPLLCGELA